MDRNSNKKRDKDEALLTAARRLGDADSDGEQQGELVFEDPFGDEFEEEDIAEDDEQDEDGDGDGNGDGNDEIMDTGGDDNGPDSEGHKQVWRPGIDRLEEGETLEYDPSAYVMYHSLRTEWPCLSFDFLKDNLGEGRQRVRFP